MPRILNEVSDEDFQRLFAYPEKLAALQRAMNILAENGLNKSHNFSALLQCLPEIEIIRDTLKKTQGQLNQLIFNKMIVEHYRAPALEVLPEGMGHPFIIIADYISDDIWDKSPHKELFEALKANHCEDLLEKDAEFEKQLAGQKDGDIRVLTKRLKKLKSTNVFTPFEQKGISDNFQTRKKILLQMIEVLGYPKDKFWMVKVLKEHKLLQGEQAPKNFLHVLNNINHSNAIKRVIDNEAVADYPDFFVSIISQGKDASALNKLLTKFRTYFKDNKYGIENLGRVIKRAPEAKVLGEILGIMQQEKQEKLFDPEFPVRAQANFEFLFDASNAGTARSILTAIQQERQNNTPITQEKFREIVKQGKTSTVTQIQTSGGSPLHLPPLQGTEVGDLDFRSNRNNSFASVSPT